MFFAQEPFKRRCFCPCNKLTLGFIKTNDYVQLIQNRHTEINLLSDLSPPRKQFKNFIFALNTHKCIIVNIDIYYKFYMWIIY